MDRQPHLDSRSVVAALKSAARKWPDRVYLGEGERKLTFGEVDLLTNRIANGLTDLGIKKGESVCTILDTHIEAILMWYAINKIGAISAPVNTSYVGEYLRHQVSDCRAELIIAESHYIDRLNSIAEGLQRAQRVIYRGKRPESTHWPAAAFETIISQNAGSPGIEVSPSDLSMLIYTSGTTGPSKGCMISHSYACQHARVMNGAHGMKFDDVIWMPLPLFHLVGTCGLSLGALMVGARVELIHKFSVSNFWNEIEATGTNFVLMMGSMLQLVAAAPDTDASKRCYGRIRMVCGAPLPASVKAAWQDRFGVKAIGSPGYGQTEASIVTQHRIGDPQPDGTSGRRFADYDVRIVNDDGTECPPGVPGEVCIRPMVPGAMFDGYWGRPEVTLAVFRDLWLHTGDLGVFDADGYFTFVDRKKDYLRKGGENISSMEMEAVFLSHPDIADVAIHAVPSDVAEDDVKATVILREGAGLREEDLCRWAIDRIPAFAVPRFIEFRDGLPRTPTGKVLKVELRKDAVTPTTWDREKSDLRTRKRLATA